MYLLYLQHYSTCWSIHVNHVQLITNIINLRTTQSFYKNITQLLSICDMVNGNEILLNLFHE
uniref:Copia protein n=1 Tax=Rhizophora mucronata TaxID=61149 RepID=A0A2P2JF68_RHIMU